MAFHEAADTGEIEESKKYVAKDILSAFEARRMWTDPYEEYIHWHREKFESIKIEKEQIVGDTATVTTWNT
ncbi:hypothetical protein [Peribacillus sp. SCS-155]|uniref:hypothetical protein n=1 Tax=Peribacillus sedimenti TaxID=3115297 RepID=UPI00390697F5